MKHQALFSSEDKSKNLKCRLLQFFFGALRVEKMFPPGYIKMRIQRQQDKQCGFR